MTSRRSKVTATARKWLARRPVYLDTETTGLRGQVIDLAVIDSNGSVLVNTLLRPTVPVEPRAAAVHHITDDMLVDAPTMADIYPTLRPILEDRLVVIYNAAFDTARLRHTTNAFGLDWPAPETACAMELYAMYHGEWNHYRRSYIWQKLGNAARQCGLEIPADLHRAAADAELTRRLMLHLGSQADG